MPIGSSIFMVSVHVYATRLDLAIMMPGSYPRAALVAYSFHHSTGVEEWRKTSLPSWIERQSDVRCGIRPTPSTLTGRSFEAKSSRPSSISPGLFARLTCSVNLLRSGVGGLLVGSALKATTVPLFWVWVIRPLQGYGAGDTLQRRWLGAISGQTLTLRHRQPRAAAPSAFRVKLSLLDGGGNTR